MSKDRAVLTIVFGILTIVSAIWLVQSIQQAFYWAGEVENANREVEQAKADVQRC